ncbi:hypothetical protein [Chryseobacterium sp. WLY505]|uniref:hypothetical protein n=1 Tax=Chryseobacterium sp. WLY505 TaxID=3068892 RepID=UPI002796B4BB|nr:hypothetical protein [Chryseobacterium sp. WLY505]MDQ1855732.1 hypothetical protein [Chryseobacterium sp. WLY505]
MKKFKNKKTNEIVEAIQFNEKNRHRTVNYVRAVQGTKYIDDVPIFTIMSNDNETAELKDNEWCVNRDKSMNPYSEVYSAVDFENTFDKL